MHRRLSGFINDLRLRSKMALIFIMFGFLPMLTLSIFQLNAVIKNLEEKTEQALTLSLSQAARRIDARIGTYNAIANGIAFDAKLGSRLLANYENLSDAVYLYHDLWALYAQVVRTEPTILGITVYTENPSLASAKPYLVHLNSLAEMEDYPRIQAAITDPYVTGARLVDRRQDYWSEADAGRRAFGLSRVVSDVSLKHKIAGVLSMSIDEGALLPLMDVNDQNATVFLVTDDGFITSSTDERLIGQSAASFFTDAVWQDSKEQEFIPLSDREDNRLMAHPLDCGLWLGALIPMNAVRAPTRQIQLFGLIWLSFTAILALSLVLFMTERLTRRIRLLLGKMSTLSIEPLDPGPPIPGRDEVGELFKGFENMVMRLKGSAHELYVVELEKREAQLIALQSRINPHFLYNALSSISWMTDTHPPESVREAIERLALFYRTSLSGGLDVVTLGEEIRGLRAYLAIQQMRAGDRVGFHIDVDELLMELKIPKMTLQPVVENCIEHGIDDVHHHVNILITSAVDESAALLLIDDDGAGVSHEAMTRIREGSISSATGGYGIRNVQMRLKLHFGEGYGMNVEPRAEGGTRVTIRIPMTTGGSDD